MTQESSLMIDPDVKLPAAVRAAAARSDKIHSQLSAGEEIDPMLVQDTPEGDIVEVTSQGNPTNPEPPRVEEIQAPEPVQTQEVKPKAAEPVADEVDWEARYKAMHGRVKQQDAAMRQMSEELSNLRALIGTMQTAPATELEPIKVERLVTDEEVNEYGRDLLDVVGRRAREEVAPLLAERDKTIADLRAQLQGVSGQVQHSAKEKLFQTLDARLPQWRDLNTNEDFLTWLGLPDAFSGVIRHEMLKEAYAQGNANRVLAFFNGFLAEEAAVAPQAQVTAPRTETVAKVPLQNLAAPGKAKATATTPVAPVEKRMISRAEIAQFYADCAAGRYRTKEPERQKLEAEIFSAQREGRIV